MITKSRKILKRKRKKKRNNTFRILMSRDIKSISALYCSKGGTKTMSKEKKELQSEILEEEKQIEKEQKQMEAKMLALILVNGILAVIVMIMIIAFISVAISDGERAEQDSLLILDKNKEVQALLVAIESREKTITEKEEDIARLQANKEELQKQLSDTQQLLSDTNGVNSKLYEDNKTLLANQDTFNDQLAAMASRLNTYERYDYAMFDTEGKRTDMNYDYITELYELTRMSAVSDIDFYLSWMMIESECHANSKNPSSTAKGFAQFLDSTSKSVYNTYLVDKYEIEWYPNIVIDRPDICIDMMQTYVNYLYKECGRDLNKTIDCYRGLHDTPYLNLFNKYLANSGKSIASVAEDTEKRWKELQEQEENNNDSFGVG